MRSATGAAAADTHAVRGSATRGCATNRTRSHRTGRPVAPAGDQDTETGPGTAKPSMTCAHRSSATCTSSQCRHGSATPRVHGKQDQKPPHRPSGGTSRRPGHRHRTRRRQALGDLHRRSPGDLYRHPVPRAIRRERFPTAGVPTAPLRPPEATPATPQERQQPEPAERASARPGRLPHRPCAGPASRAPRGPDKVPRQAPSAPNRPPRTRGRGHCLASPGQGLAWLASTLTKPATGRIPVLTGNRAQPVAGHLVCS